MTYGSVLSFAPSFVPSFVLSFVPSSDPLSDPFGWIFGAGVNAAQDTLVTILSGVWQGGLWLLELAFRLVDAFTTPDLSATGPMSYVLPVTLWLGGFVAVVMLLVQVVIALVRRDGQSVGRVFLGLAQFAIVWGAFVAVGAGVVAAAGGLEHGILSATLNVDVLASWNGYRSWVRGGADLAGAFILAVTSLLLLIPASFAYILVALVREASLIVLTAAAPIAAAGLLSDVSRAWFWKSLRWFLSAAFIAPGSALVLGIGVRFSNGVIAGAGAAGPTGLGSPGTMNAADALGSGVVGAALVAVAAVAPLTLFRLLAFVEPSTVSGAAMRQAWADFSHRAGTSGSPAGAGGGSGSGAGAATATDGAGRAQGEASAASATQSRLTSALGMYGWAMQTTTSLAHRAIDVSTDILGSAGVGHPGYSMTPADERALRGSQPQPDGSGNAGQGAPGPSGPGGGPSDGTGGAPGTSGTPGTPGGPGTPAASGGPAPSPAAGPGAGMGTGAGAAGAGAAPVVVP